MTLGEAILAAHRRRDTATRNQLMRYAREHGARIREICEITGLTPSSVFAASGKSNARPNPLCQPFDPSILDAKSASDAVGKIARAYENRPGDAGNVPGPAQEEGS